MPSAVRELGADLVIESLRAGDYHLGRATLVERKTVADLHRSVATGRLWHQLQKLRADADRAWLLVEGPRLDEGRISAHGIRGAILAVVETGIPVIWSASPRDSALWLLRLAAHVRATDAPGRWVMRAPRRRARPAPVRILCEIPGISPRLAARLLEAFGSVAAIALASEQDLMSLAGIGEARARSLLTSLSGTSREVGSAP